MARPYDVELLLNGLPLAASSLDLSAQPPFINNIPYTDVQAGQVTSITGVHDSIVLVVFCRCIYRIGHPEKYLLLIIPKKMYL